MYYGVDKYKSLREQGYAFEKDLEEQAKDFVKEWREIAPELEIQIDKETRGLVSSLRPLETRITQLAGDSSAPTAKRPHVERLKAEVETLWALTMRLEMGPIRWMVLVSNRLSHDL